jgi:hypothetical protein
VVGLVPVQLHGPGVQRGGGVQSAQHSHAIMRTPPARARFVCDARR